MAGTLNSDLVRFLCENCDTELTGSYGDIKCCPHCQEWQETPDQNAATLGQCRHCQTETWVNNLSQCYSCEEQ